MTDMQAGGWVGRIGKYGVLEKHGFGTSTTKKCQKKPKMVLDVDTDTGRQLPTCDVVEARGVFVAGSRRRRGRGGWIMDLNVGAWKSAAFAEDDEALFARDVAFHKVLGGNGRAS